ncbi:hypothetical protein BDV96DRAFT_561442 [Lophiotrema nucula]|uniref:Uncharacterized protein n=1 Tax=Lophiotrema nucula TaxID=690887 RepID=A0A6A5ZV32_9PLEO|nr:hypothetical protein BDV96DRAFT_561442 [Lophiotrema nucula]
MPPSISTSSTPWSQPLKISPTADDDPLGILEISGFYGPGAWLGWLLTIITSWYNLYRKPSARRPQDTIVFLLGTHWAALDLIHRTSLARKVTVEELNGMQGSIAAAFLVTYWGLFCALSQIMACFIQSSAQWAPLSRRGVILLFGAALPSISLANLFRLLGPFFNQPNTTNFERLSSIPALYIEGVEVQFLLLNFAASLGVASIILLCLVILTVVDNAFHTRQGLGFDPFELPALIIASLWLVAPISAIVNVKRTWNPLWWLVGGIFGPFFAMIGFMLPLFPIIFLIFGAYSPSKACYFMPCAPQSIYEWDQAFALCIGLCILVVEIGPDVLKPARRRWRSFWTRSAEDAPLLEGEPV